MRSCALKEWLGAEDGPDSGRAAAGESVGGDFCFGLCNFLIILCYSCGRCLGKPQTSSSSGLDAFTDA